MKAILFVFLGGGLGSGLRYILTKLINNLGSIFPLGTLTVNVVGSLLIGFLIGLSIKSNSLSENSMLFLATGFCGGFTTFSAFSYENYQFLKNGDLINFGIYGLGSVIVGVFAVFAGIWISRIV